MAHKVQGLMQVFNLFNIFSYKTNLNLVTFGSVNQLKSIYMNTPAYFRQTILSILVLAPSFAFAQTNTEKIKAKWSVKKFEVEKNTAQSIQAQKDLLGVCLTFGNEELVISKKTETSDSVI